MKKLITVSAVTVLLSGAFAVPATAATTTIASASWGLDRIDQDSSELDNRYTSPESGGEFRNPTRGRMATFRVTAVTAGGDSKASSPVTVRIR